MIVMAIVVMRQMVIVRKRSKERGDHSLSYGIMSKDIDGM